MLTYACFLCVIYINHAYCILFNMHILKNRYFFLYHTPKSIVTHIYSFLAQNQSGVNNGFLPNDDM